jgi:hypothetical protein
MVCGGAAGGDYGASPLQYLPHPTRRTNNAREVQCQGWRRPGRRLTGTAFTEAEYDHLPWCAASGRRRCPRRSLRRGERAIGPLPVRTPERRPARRHALAPKRRMTSLARLAPPPLRLGSPCFAASHARRTMVPPGDLSPAQAPHLQTENDHAREVEREGRRHHLRRLNLRGTSPAAVRGSRSRNRGSGPSARSPFAFRHAEPTPGGGHRSRTGLHVDPSGGMARAAKRGRVSIARLAPPALRLGSPWFAASRARCTMVPPGGLSPAHDPHPQTENDHAREVQRQGRRHRFRRLTRRGTNPATVTTRRRRGRGVSHWLTPRLLSGRCGGQAPRLLAPGPGTISRPLPAAARVRRRPVPPSFRTPFRNRPCP